MSGPDTLTRDDDIDVVGIFSALKRKWWLILLVTLVAGAALLMTLSMVSPRYESSARILVRDGDTTFTRATGSGGQQQSTARFDEQAVRSEAEIIQSNNLILEVIDALDLTSLEEFKGDSEYNEVRTRILEFAGQADRIGPPRETTAEDDDRNKALRVFKKKLTVYAVEKSRVIVIDFWSHNPELAQTIVSELSQRYIVKKRNAKIRDSESATVWLDPKIAELEKDVRSTEAAVADFRASSDILRSDNNNALLATQQLSQVSTELSRLKAERSSAQAKVASIRAALQNGSSLDVIPEVMESPLIQRLREREVSLRARISDLSTTLLPNHPRMKALNSQLSDFEGQINTATRNIVISLENNVDLARQSEADLEKEIVRLKAEAVRVDEKLVELRSLEREADAAKALLQEYKSRSLEAKTRSGLTQVDAEIISPASLADDPYFPKIVPFATAGMVAAALLTTLAIIAVNLLSAVSSHHAVSKLKEAKNDDHEAELEELTAEVPIDNESGAAIPRRLRKHYRGLQSLLHKNEQPVEPESVEGAPLAIRRATEVLISQGSAGICVLSPGGDIGSSTSWILARKLAESDKKVVLIDLSGGAYSTQKMLGAAEYPGIFNLVSGSVGVGEILHQDRDSEVIVVPTGTSFPELEKIDTDMLSEMIHAIAASFDFCIVDCGDAEIEELKLIAKTESLVVISCIKAEVSHVEALESQLAKAGFDDVVRLCPDRADIGKVKEAA